MTLILSWIIFGVLMGWIASLLSSNSSRRTAENIVLGAIAAVLSGLLFRTLFEPNQAITGLNVTSLIVSITGAAAILFLKGLRKV